MLEEALGRSGALPIFDNSHRGVDANLIGSIGELAFERFLDHHAISFRDDRTSTRHDYVVGRSTTIDVKTKDRTCWPRTGFDNSVPLYNHGHQRPDYYYFVSLLRDPEASADDPRRFKFANMVGGISQAGLGQVGVEWKREQVDPSNGMKFWTACINVGTPDLASNDEMLAILRAA
jgi:hypothetical protein